MDRAVPFAQACLLGCGVVTGAGAAINTAGVRPGDTFAVIGTGGVGLNAIDGARVAGASKIIAIDIADTKLDAARRFGATDTINSANVDPVEAVRDLTNGGVDHAFEVIGLVSTQAQAVAMTGIGGSAYFIGMAKPGSPIELETSPFEMLTTQRAVRGVNMGSTNIKRDIPMYAELYLQGRFNLDDLVTQTIDIGDINQAYTDLAGGNIIRSVVTTFDASPSNQTEATATVA